LIHAGSQAIVRTAGSGTITCTGNVSAIEANLGAGNDELVIGQGVPHSIPSTLEGGTGSDKLVGGPANDVLYAGEDSDPDTLEGGGGNDVLYGVNIFHPKKDSGAATMNGGPGSDLMIGGQPCDGDTFNGGPGANDSASFARVHNSGVAVEATIGGEVIEHLHGGLGIALLDFGGEVEARQQAVAVRRLGDEIGKSGLGLAVLVLLGELDCLVEGIAGFGGLLGFEILIAAPAADGGDDHPEDLASVAVTEGDPRERD